MGFPKKISQLPIASSINDNDILVLVHDDVTSQITFDKLIFSADTNTFVTGTTLVGTTYTINENNGSSFITDFNTIVSGKVNTTLFDSYTATTETEIDSKLDITTFDTYTAGTVDANTFVTGGTLTGANLILEKNNDVDASPIDLSALSGATFSWSDPVVTAGNTSGDCINELWVSSISGCSPVNIGTGLEVEGGLTVEGSLSATTFFGDGSGLDGVQANIPFTTLTPGATVAWDFDVAGENTKLTPDSGATAPNQIVPTNFPNGAHGYLIIDASNTVDFKLPTNSLITNGLVTPSEGSETKYSYIYDGTTFYWSIENNLIVPVYSTWASTNLVSDYDPASYGGAGGDVPDGTTWINSYTNNNLIGDLTKDGDPDEIQFVLADIPSETPAHWDFDDAFSLAAWHRPSSLSPTSFAGSWNGTVWLQNRGTQDSWQGIMDGDKDDSDVMYIYQNRPMYQDTGFSNVFSNFPALITGSTGENYDLADKWTYWSLSCDESGNTVTFVIGCQLTMDNAGGTIEGFDGNPITIEADGTYVETVGATVTSDAWANFTLGSAHTNVYEFRGRMGKVAVYNTNISSAIQRENWERTRETYYIT